MVLTDEVITRNHSLNIETIKNALSLESDEEIVQVDLDYPEKNVGYVRFTTQKINKMRSQPPAQEEETGQ